MLILSELTEVEKEDFRCEVFNCPNRADYYVTDGEEEGEGYICKKCNEEDDIAAKGWE